MAKGAGRRRLARGLILAGALLLAAAAGLEAAKFPWRLFLGAGLETLPDPPPLVLKGEDAGVPLVTAGPEQTAKSAEPAGSGAPSTVPQEQSSGTLPGEEAKHAPPEAFVQLGVIKIPALGVSKHVLEGAGRQLYYGVGHVEGTAAPGRQGNCVLAGHRSTAFRYLNKLAKGDRVILEKSGEQHVYTVYESFDVLPGETWVLEAVPGEGAVLTLVTCTPYLVYSHRLIVRARLSE